MIASAKASCVGGVRQQAILAGRDPFAYGLEVSGDGQTAAGHSLEQGVGCSVMHAR